MRMAFGLVSLLVTFAVILWMMIGTGYLPAVAKQNKQMKQQVNVMGGYDPERQILATDSIHYRVERAGSKPKLIVTEVMAGGPMDERYGLMANDNVVEIGGLDFESNIGSRDAATDWFHTAYARNQPIVVVRNGEKLTLPTPAHVAMIAERDRKAAIAAAAAQNAPPPTPTASSADEGNALTKALDAVRSKPK